MPNNNFSPSKKSNLIREIIELYERNEISGVGSRISDLLRIDGIPLESALHEVYSEFCNQQKPDLGTYFLLSCLSNDSFQGADIILLTEFLDEEIDRNTIINLFILYCSRHGKNITPYEKSISFFSSTNNSDFVKNIYAYCEEAGLVDSLSESAQFNCAAVLQQAGHIEKAFKIYERLLSDDPTFEECRRNICLIAKEAHHPEAIAFYRNEMSMIASSYPAPTLGSAEGATETEFSEPFDAPKIAEAIAARGFCILRGGCHKDSIEEIVNHVVNGRYKEYPVLFDDFLIHSTSKIFLFDINFVASTLLGGNANRDHQSSVLRHVCSATEGSATPFHQDSTAFVKPILNVWIPLTPAGGAFPTIQLVKRRIDTAEQTRLTAGDYNLVEIEESKVLARYGNDLQVVEHAIPGDCVIFLGTTIHRSFNVRTSKMPRFNLEIRWALQ